MKLQLCYLDDEIELLELMQDYLSSDQIEVHSFSNAESLMNYLSENRSHTDLVFIDQNLHGKSGVEVASEIEARFGREIEKVLITGEAFMKKPPQFSRVFGKPFEFAAINSFLYQHYEEKNHAIHVA